MTKDEALKLSMEAMEITGGFDVEITAIKEALAQPEPWEKFCDSNCVWTDHHLDCKLAEQSTECGEPVALETVYETIIQWDEGGGKRSRRELARRIVSLYTTPPQRKPLTAMEVYDVVHDADLDWHTGFALGEDENRFVVFARAIEAAHGIKGEA